MALNCPVCSLVQYSLEQILVEPALSKQLISLGFAPRMYHAIFTEVANLIIGKRNLRDVGIGVKLLVSHWPSERFSVNELLPEEQAVTMLVLMRRDQNLLQMIMDGLLHLDAASPLRCVDFRGIYIPTLFQLPLLAMPAEERNSERILNIIQSTCKEFYHESQEDDNLESVLAWKLKDIKHKSSTGDLTIPKKDGLIIVETECQVNLSEWLAMHEVMLSLILQPITAFRMHVYRISVDNYHLRQIPHLKWLMTMVGTQILKEVVFYGTRKSISLLMWDIGDFLQRFENIHSFGMGTMGPKLLTYAEPSVEEITLATCQVLNKWRHLSELHLLGTVLKLQVNHLLSAIPNTLKKLKLAACSLHRFDLLSIANSHHVNHLEDLNLEKNDLRGMGNELCTVLKKSSCLVNLSLKETNLTLEDKIEVLNVLQGSKTINLLLLYENEAMVTAEGYIAMIEMGCHIVSLKKFYLFPFNYKPFEVSLRRIVESSCCKLLTKHNRDDLCLAY